MFYRKNFGPKGYGFGGGAGTLSMDDGAGYKSNPNAVDHKAKAYIAPKKPLVPSNSSTNIKGLYEYNIVIQMLMLTVENGSAPEPVKKATAGVKSKPKWGGAEVCPRCGKSVFIAELMRAAGKAWHKSCFTCNICNKRVDSSTLCEREGEIYCRSCYGKNFGPKGIGFGIGNMTTTA